MRTPTAGTKYQNEPIQASLQKVEQSSSFNDAEVNALPQTSPESSVMPLNPIDDVMYESRIQRRLKRFSKKR